MLLPVEQECLPNGEILDSALALAVQMIKERSCSGLTVEDLVNATHLPRRTLERRFQRYLKTSPHTEILKVQIAKARELLITTHLKLADIASQTGFRSVSHLCVAIKREFQITPNAIRQRGF
ncbi:MAG: helix-turn-helix transcriptional regulator [Thermoguttaceae bacterium]|nr:helix-turn-helix transcriptional regulator [Thermoguttaceae bacterium]